MGSILKSPQIDNPVPVGPGKNHIRRDYVKSSVIMAAVALSIGIILPSCVMAEMAVLEPVPDKNISILLERNFTLPMVLEDATLSREDRQDLIATEATRLTALLVSRGFLEARVKTSGLATDEGPLRLEAVPGPLYRFGEIRVNGIPPERDAALDAILEDARSKQTGAPALRSVVDDLEERLLFDLRQASFADAKLRETTFDLDRLTGIADLTLTVDPGQPMRLGKVLFRGSLRMDPAEAQALVPFASGSPYSLDAIEALRRALEQTDAFRRIRIETFPDPDQPGVIDLSVRLWDRAQLLLDGAQPRLLLFTILMLAVIQMVRMTSHWSHRDSRLLLVIPAVLMISGSALEVTSRLQGFLTALLSEAAD